MSSFIIEIILGEDVNLLGDTYVRVKWEGYPSSYNSWVLKSSLVEGEEVGTDSQLTCSEDRSNFVSASDAVANVWLIGH